MSYRTSITDFFNTGNCSCDKCKTGPVLLPFWFEVLGVLIFTLLFAPYAEYGILYFASSWIIWELAIYSKLVYTNKTEEYIVKRKIAIIAISITAWVITRDILGFERFWYCSPGVNCWFKRQGLPKTPLLTR